MKGTSKINRIYDNNLFEFELNYRHDSMEGFINYLKQNSRLDDLSIQSLLEICTSSEIKKNNFVLNEGEVCHHMYFISRGLVRIYYYKEHKDISEWFAFDNSYCFSIMSYFNSTPSKLIIQCIEESKVVFIPKNEFNMLRQENSEIANYAYDLLARSLIYSQERMFSLQFETAQQRYLNLIKMHRNILQRVPLQFIASYLGISPETLSRIRNQIY